MLSDSTMKVRIRTVTRNLKVTLSGVSPVSNEEIADYTSKVWAHKDKLYVETDRPETVYVFTTMGHLYRRESIQAGLTVFDNMKSGIYFVKFGNGQSAKVLVE